MNRDLQRDLERIQQILNAFLTVEVTQPAQDLNPLLPPPTQQDASGRSLRTQPQYLESAYTIGEVNELVNEVAARLERSGYALDRAAVAAHLFSEIPYPLERTPNGRVVVERLFPPDSPLNESQKVVMGNVTTELVDRNPRFMTENRKLVYMAHEMYAGGLISAPLYNLVRGDTSPQNIAAVKATRPDLRMRDDEEIKTLGFEYLAQLDRAVEQIAFDSSNMRWQTAVRNSIGDDVRVLQDNPTPLDQDLLLPTFGVSPQQMAQEHLDREFIARFGGATSDSDRRQAIEGLLNAWVPHRTGRGDEYNRAHGAVGREIADEAVAASQQFANLRLAETGVPLTPAEIGRYVFDHVVQAITGGGATDEPYQQRVAANLESTRTDKEMAEREKIRVSLATDHSRAVNFLKNVAQTGYRDGDSLVGIDLSDSMADQLGRMLQDDLMANPDLDPNDWAQQVITNQGSMLNQVSRQQGFADISDNIDYAKEAATDFGIDLSGISDAQLHEIGSWMQSNAAALSEQELAENLFGQLANTVARIDAAERAEAEAREGERQTAQFTRRFASPSGRAGVARDLFVESGHLGADTDPRTRNYIEDTLVPRLAESLEFLPLDQLESPDVASVGDLLTRQSAFSPLTGRLAPQGAPQAPFSMTPQEAARNQQTVASEWSRILTIAERGGQLSESEIDRLEALAPSRNLSRGDVAKIGELVSLQRNPLPDDAPDLFLQAAGEDRGFLRYLLDQRRNLRLDYGRLPEHTVDTTAIQSFQDAARAKLGDTPDYEPGTTHPGVLSETPMNRTERAVLDPRNAASLNRSFRQSRPSFGSWFRDQLPRLRADYGQTNAGILARFDTRQDMDEVGSRRRQDFPTIYRVS